MVYTRKQKKSVAFENAQKCQVPKKTDGRLQRHRFMPFENQPYCSRRDECEKKILLMWLVFWLSGRFSSSRVVVVSDPLHFTRVVIYYSWAVPSCVVMFILNLYEYLVLALITDFL